MKRNLYILFLILFTSVITPGYLLAAGSVDVEVISEDVFDFSLTAKDNQVQIIWDNIPEDTRSFKIERSFDGKRFSRIYQSSFLTEFTFSDDLSYINADDVYYRFTFFLSNDREVVSNTKLISLSSQNHLKAQVIATGGQVSFTFFSVSHGITRIQVFNNVGNLIGEDQIRTDRGENSHDMTFYGLRSGLYFLRLEHNGKTTTTKFFYR